MKKSSREEVAQHISPRQSCVALPLDGRFPEALEAPPKSPEAPRVHHLRAPATVGAAAIPSPKRPVCTYTLTYHVMSIVMSMSGAVDALTQSVRSIRSSLTERPNPTQPPDFI